MTLIKKNKTEALLQSYFRRQIKKLPDPCEHWKISDRYTSNLPDNVVIYHGRTWFVELKAESKKLRNGQEFVGSKIMAAGGLFASCNDRSQVDRLIDFIKA